VFTPLVLSLPIFPDRERSPLFGDKTNKTEKEKKTGKAARREKRSRGFAHFMLAALM
jgi:hypothetical protein